MAKETAPRYKRGTPTSTVRTAKLRADRQVVTTPIPPNLRANEPMTVRPLGTPLAGHVRTVEQVQRREVALTDGWSFHTFDVRFTDGTVAFDVGPLVNWVTVD